MGTKNHPGKFDCYANADPDEPMFILLGRDPHAHAAVRKWANDRETMIRAGLKPETDMPMVWEARECADAMEMFHINRRKLNVIEPPIRHPLGYIEAGIHVGQSSTDKMWYWQSEHDPYAKRHGPHRTAEECRKAAGLPP